MKPLLGLLASVDGADVIRRCWGEVPPFRYGEMLHIQRTALGDGEEAAILTAFVMTDGAENANECKPSKIVVEFSSVSHWEHDCYAKNNGIQLSEILSSPPSGTMTIEIFNSFYVVCRKLRVVSCEHDPFV